MSAKETLRAWLDDAGVEYTDVDVTDAWGDPVSDDAIRIDAPNNWNPKDKNDGYAGFFTLVTFDPEGNVLKFGSWE